MLKRYPNTQQYDEQDCAVAVVINILEYYKCKQDINSVRESLNTNHDGTSVYDIKKYLETQNFNVKAVRVSLEDIDSTVSIPTILHIINDKGFNHFVVLYRINKKRIFIVADPANNKIQKYTESEISEKYSGVALFMVPNSLFERKKIKNNSIFEMFRLIILPNKRILSLIMVLSVVLSVFGISVSFISKLFFDEIIPYQLKDSIGITLILYCTFLILQSLLSYLRQYLFLFLSRKIDSSLLLSYYHHILHLPYSFYTTRRVGDIMTRFQDAMVIKNILTTVSVSLPLDTIMAIITSLFLMKINSSFFTILMVGIVINIGLIFLFKNSYRVLNIEQMEVQSLLNSHIIETFHNIDSIKSTSDEQQQFEKLEHKVMKYIKTNFKEGILTNTHQTLATIINSLSNGIFIGFGAYFIIENKLSFGEYIAFQSLSQYFIEPIQNLVNLQLSYQELKLSINRFYETMAIRNEVDNDTLHLSYKDGDICIKSMCFSYGSKEILRNINLTIKQGSKVAFVGESGAGKSTLAHLIMKYMSGYTGTIEISENELSDINTSELRAQLSYIPQRIELFSGTILENLKIGNCNSTYEAIVNASKKSGAHKFINRLPLKYESVVEEGGRNLSFGEQQRLMIARAIVTRKKIYIFDEITSNLDALSERNIDSIIYDDLKNETVIMIAHRLSTVFRCDCIYYLEEGQIVEFGTHQELMKQNGKYATMIKQQEYTKERL